MKSNEVAIERRKKRRELERAIWSEMWPRKHGVEIGTRAARRAIAEKHLIMGLASDKIQPKRVP